MTAAFRFWLVFLAASAVFATVQAENTPPVVHLTQHGQAAMPVVISPNASNQVRDLAATLAAYLGRIAEARFEVVVGDGSTGLVLGKADEFPKLHLRSALDAAGLGADEQYLLRSHAYGLYAVGASDTAVEHAAWDLLYRLGYRQFFPGPVWEFVPKRRNLAIAVDAHESPDYAYRAIWYGWGTAGYNNEPFRQWRIRNRMTSTFKLETGHAYKAILRQYRPEFDAHPEYMALLGGERVLPTDSGAKFCTADPGLRNLILRYAEDYFRSNPTSQCVPIDPSDGDGWCECDRCLAMGTPSDRALTLANDISEMLETKYPDKYVGMYAYHQHSLPPNIAVRPRVIISIATAFLQDGWTLDEVIEGWKRQGAGQFGIREYYAVNEWHRDLPGAPRAARPNYLAETLPKFHALGARFLSAESSDNWAVCGPGYYVASRLLWNVEEASSVDALMEDFLAKCFGPAKSTMAEYYGLLSSPTAPVMSRGAPKVSPELVGQMYQLLAEATAATTDPAVQMRIDQLVLYTRYVELFRAYGAAEKESRQAAFEQMIRHAYRMRETMMVHTRALYEDLVTRDSSITIPIGAAWHVSEESNPWKSSRAWERKELDALLDRGIQESRTVQVRPPADLHP